MGCSRYDLDIINITHFAATMEAHSITEKASPAPAALASRNYEMCLELADREEFMRGKLACKTEFMEMA